jgi:hypothetical protein
MLFSDLQIERAAAPTANNAKKHLVHFIFSSVKEKRIFIRNLNVQEYKLYTKQNTNKT